jgi:hypothetical protein
MEVCMGDLLTGIDKSDKVNYSTTELREALRKKYAMPEYCLMEEVRDAAGFSGKRSADAIAMAMWESRGLEVIGFEIKSYRSDWLKELRNPAKAEAIAVYCDRWFIVAAPNVVREDELPAEWGLLVPRGKAGLVAAKAAPKREAKPLSKTFIAAMMRRCGERDERMVQALIRDKVEEAKAGVQEHIQREVKDRSRKYDELVQKLEKIKASTGIDLTGYNPDERTAAAIKFALTHDLTERYGALSRLADNMRKALAQLEPALAAAGIEGTKT